MDFLLTVWDYILHLDKYLEQLIGFGGIWVYVIMAFVVFAETAFVVTVFLPSDTILFAACALLCKAITREDCLLLPKGAKIAKVLHL